MAAISSSRLGHTDFHINTRQVSSIPTKTSPTFSFFLLHHHHHPSPLPEADRHTGPQNIWIFLDSTHTSRLLLDGVGFFFSLCFLFCLNNCTNIFPTPALISHNTATTKTAPPLTNYLSAAQALPLASLLSIAHRLSILL